MGLDRAIDNSVKPAGDGSGKSVLQVVEEEFPKAFKETDFAKTYPMEAVDIMDFFMHGLAAQESKYNRFALSEDGALGVWQFMPITARAMGLKAGGYTDERTDVKKSTRAAAKYIDRIYYRLIKNSPILEVMRKFGVSAEDFIVPCIMNSYHSGPTNVYKMISWFSEAHTPESFAEEFGTGPYGKDLYFLMSKLYVESGQSGNYKKHSREYYLRVMAMYVGVKAKLSDPNADIGTISGYEAPSNGAVPDEAKDAGRSLKAQSDCQSVHSIDRQINGKWVETAIYGLAVPAALAMVLAGIRSKCGGVVKRRHFIMYPVAISLGALLNRFNKDVRTHTVDLEKDVFRPECNVPIEGLDGADAMAELDAYMDKEYTYDKSLVSDFLEIAGKGPKVPTLTTPEFTSLSPANTAHNAAVSIAYAKKQGLAKFASEDDIKHRIKADKYSASGELIQLPGNGYKFRLRGIGQTGSSARNNPLYAYTYPSSQNVLNGISLELNRELQAAGFPAGLYARPIITGASRTDEFQKKLQKGNSNAVDDTPHKYLNAFDISYARFDVLDPQTGRFYMVAKGDELDRKFNLLRKYDSALGRIMLTLMGERIENSKRLSEPAQVFDRPIVRCRRETNQACYHFSTETGLEGTK
ncbi:transglycosylase SLT domain-containing protein [Patescibacteria group bacterium]|nr:transglycosylase SLT domain-containing protein [Patescibacteria group bacterium]